MPLLLPTLQNEFTNLLDKNAGGFVGFGATPPQVAANWAAVYFNYSGGITPPSTTTSVAQALMINALIPGVAPGAFIPALVSASTIFATQLGIGMTPTYTAVPPPLPIDFTPVISLPLGTPVATIINTFATIVDTWFRTGTATLVAPPYTVVPWS